MDKNIGKEDIICGKIKKFENAVPQLKRSAISL